MQSKTSQMPLNLQASAIHQTSQTTLYIFVCRRFRSNLEKKKKFTHAKCECIYLYEWFVCGEDFFIARLKKLLQKKEEEKKAITTRARWLYELAILNVAFNLKSNYF